MSHRYAAVLAADVAHYSRLMESDGEGTVQALKDCREIFRRVVTSHRGREFGSVGDSLMAEFRSPVEALRAARDIQAAIRHTNGHKPSGDCLEIRIGVHAGDVIGDGGDIYGDVVNTAARLQEIASTGGIALSGLVHEQVRKEPDIAFRFLGKQFLKNIAEPVSVYEVQYRKRLVNWRRWRLAMRPYRSAIAAVAGMTIAAAVIVAFVRTGPETLPPIPVPEPDSIIVLAPTVSAPEEERTVLNGLQCRLIEKLERLKSLSRVIACRSASKVNPESTLREIGRQFGVAIVLAPSIVLEGRRLHIGVELIRAETESLIWAESYDSDYTAEALLESETSIAQDVVVQLGLDLTPAQDRQISAIPTHSMEALREYEFGRFEIEKRDAAAFMRAQSHFLAAIDLDPMFADAYVGLAMLFALRGEYYYEFYGPKKLNSQRQYLLDRALELDPDNSLALATLGSLKLSNGDEDEAQRLFRRAMELAPNAYEPRHWYGLYQRSQGRDDEAFALAQEAYQIAPKEPTVVIRLAKLLDEAGRQEEASNLVLASLPDNPDYIEYYRFIYGWHWDKGRIGEALRWAEAAQSMAPHNALVHLELCQLYFRLEDYEQTQHCLDGLRKWGKFFWQHEIALAQQRGNSDAVRGILEWHSGRPIGPQERTTIYTNHRGRIEEAYYWLQIDETDRAFEIMRTYGPQLFDDDGRFTGAVDISKPLVEPVDVYMAFYAAVVLQRQGETERAAPIFDAVLQWVDDNKPLPRDHFDPGQFWGGPLDVMPIYAIRQDREAALRMLREAADAGYTGWFAQSTAMFDFIRDDPEWQELMARLAENAERQWQWYREHKAEPLFARAN